MGLENGEKKLSREGLVRSIGPLALGTNVFNMVVGAGIFVLPGVVASHLGASAIFAYLICGLAVSMIFLCYAEIGSRVRRSGGSYAYIEDAFGPFAGFIASMLLWFGWAILSDAALLVILTETIILIVPEVDNQIFRILFMTGLIAFLVFTNVRGVESGKKLYIANTIAKVIPLGLLVIFGFFAINFDNLTITEWPSVEQIGASTLILFFAFSGAECALNASGEIEKPEKTVPRGIMLGIGSILMLYLALQTVAQGVLGADLGNNTEAPLSATAEIIFGSWGGKMLLVGTAISIFATLSGDILVTPRVVFASARDGNLPKFLAKVHPKFNTPYMSVIVFSALLLLIAFSGTFETLAILASGSIMLIYAGVSLSVIKVRMRDGMPSREQFKLPGGAIIPMLSCSLIAWMLFQLETNEALGLIALVGVSVLIYLANQLMKKKSS
ncbi:APC family permease [Pseudemcibacter aquimaris]|uniref:APC family permease n=1 Tax=Pseudemcibacter aquimaris TaxID=2857064 RepID=UPI002012275E|nr:amino acid permease [Pseudemcibacter aquimaris]MCC3861227.1 amino acid permease [Pseudemcibacter aquimaris]WDU58002.1 amino acid permease [Pseudemcibacter aquimaris]